MTASVVAKTATAASTASTTGMPTRLVCEGAGALSLSIVAAAPELSVSWLARARDDVARVLPGDARTDASAAVVRVHAAAACIEAGRAHRRGRRALRIGILVGLESRLGVHIVG